jgi:flavin-dependent dehydrogenase
VPQIQANWLGAAVRGHSEAITDWITGEVDTAERAARAQAEAIAEAKNDQARARYQDLTKAELADLLGQRDLPRNGTVEELVDRLVDADTQ